MSLVTQLTAAFTRVGQEVKSVRAALKTHTDNVSNPHAVTKAQVGLGNASNTADADKPISTATQTALNSKMTTTLLGSGVTTVPAGSPVGSYFYQ